MFNLTFSYFTIQPVTSPVSCRARIENLLIFTDYQLVIRLRMMIQQDKFQTITSDTVFFNTASKSYHDVSKDSRLSPH